MVCVSYHTMGNFRGRKQQISESQDFMGQTYHGLSASTIEFNALPKKNNTF